MTREVRKKSALTGANRHRALFTPHAVAYLSSILELKGTSIEQIYLDAALRSMTIMRKALYVGYSWHAYKSWSNRWPGIIASNRALIRKHIEANTAWPDALAVVRSA